MYSNITDTYFLIDDFVIYKRTLGYKYDSEYRVINTFKRYVLEASNKNITTLNKQLIDGWCELRISESRKSQSNRISILRQLAIFITNKGYLIHMPRSIYNYANKAFVPYIFTFAEMDQIFKTLDNLPNYAWSNSSTLYPVLFRMLYGCGLRIGEALELRIEDINLKTGVVIIRNSKNDKSRLVMMSESLKKICINYKNQNLSNSTTGDFFFPNKIGKKRGGAQISSYFKEILWKSGITYSGRNKGPRVHDIRHTFCCHTLKRMLDNGIDMYCSLPILSTYLGHSGIKATEKYLRLTQSIFPEINLKINGYTSSIYPEVYHE
jgi:integrase